MAVNSVMRKCLAVALLAAFVVAAGCTVNPVTGKRELIVIPESQEIAMGKQAVPGFITQFEGEVPDQALQAYVQEIGQKMAVVSDRPGLPYKYRLVKSKIPNAFALPGGEIFVTAGLMALMDNERELAAVLGHETGHCCALHGVKGM
jgi:predicted Zn-dependent protease